MAAKSQLLKGILEGCILAVISERPTYGYELSVRLTEKGLHSVSEGSIYPILLRLQKDKWITGRMEKSPAGPNRKYYSLTADGEEALLAFRHEWEGLKIPVDRILKGEDA